MKVTAHDLGKQKEATIQYGRGLISRVLEDEDGEGSDDEGWLGVDVVKKEKGKMLLPVP